MAKKPTTIYDIAADLGISAATVSRNFRSPHLVSVATRRRVMEAAERLGYRPNGLARGLIGGSIAALGLMVPNVHNPSFAEIIEAVEEASYQAGYALLLGNAQDNTTKERELFETLLSYKVAGIILIAPRTSDLELHHWLEGGVPLVLVNRRLMRPMCDGVTVDQMGLARMAVEHLAATNRRSILYLPGPRASQANQLRAEAARQTAHELGLQLHILDTDDLSVRLIAERLSQHLDAVPPFDAVLAYHDLMALGAMHALSTQGIGIPESVGVCGFDNVIWGEFASPPLTSMAQPLKELGERAVSTLRDRIEKPSTDLVDAVLPGRLVVRGSTVPTASSE